MVLKGVVEEERRTRVRVHQALASTDVAPQLLEQMRRFCDTEMFETENKLPAYPQQTS